MPSGPSLLKLRLSVQMAPVGRLELDAHVHGNAGILRMDGALDGVGDDGAAALVGEQVPPMWAAWCPAGGPSAAGLARRVHVGTAEEIGLHIHLLDVELAVP